MVMLVTFMVAMLTASVKSDADIYNPFDELGIDPVR